MPLIAEALIRVRPDLTGFRAEVETELRAALAGVRAPAIPVTAVPVTARVGDIEGEAARGAAAQTAAAAAADQQTRAITRQTEAKRIANAEERRRIAALEAEAAAASRLGVAEQLAATGVLRLAEVERQATAATSARRAAQTAAQTAARTGDQALIQSTLRLLATAEAREASSRRLLVAVRAQAIAEQRLSLIQQAGAAATTQIQAAQRALSASKAAVVAASRAETLALEAENVALQQNAASSLATAHASEAVAAASLQQARGAQTNAQRLGQTARGAVGAALGFAGLRGAMLASTASFLAGAAAITAIGKSLATAAQFEQQLNIFRVTADATDESMQKAAATARQLGADITLPGVTALDAARTFTELSRAGLSIQDSFDAARGTLQLATAAEIDNASATDLVANALGAFQLRGTEATHVADTFAAASAAAQGSISEIGIALQQSAGAAAQVGVSFEDTVALLTILAERGLRGSDAGTSLRVALLRLVRPTGAARDLLRDLNVSLRDLQGNIRPEAFAELGEKLAALGPAARQAALSTIFGVDAFRTAGFLAEAGAAGLAQAREEIDREGFAAEVAAAKNKGLLGEIDALGSGLSTLGERLGSIAIQALTDFVSVMNDAVAAANIAADALARLGGQEIVAGVTAADALRVAWDNIKPSATRLIPVLGPVVVTVKQIKGAFDDAGESIADVTKLADEFAARFPRAIEGAGGLLQAPTPTPPLTESIEALRPFLAPSERLDIQQIEAQARGDLQGQLRLARIEEERRSNELARLREEGVSHERFVRARTNLANARLAVTQLEERIAQKEEQERNAARARRQARDRKREQDAAKALAERREAVGLEQERLAFGLEQAQRREAIQLIQRRGAELVRFFQAQARNEDFSAREQAGFARQATQTAQETKDAIDKIRQQRLEEAQAFALMQIETRKLAAQLTPTERDNIAAAQAEIRFWQRAIEKTRLRGAERKRFIGEARQNILRGQLEIQQLRGDQQQFQADLTAFFAEAQRDIARFGPNIQLGPGGQLAGLLPVRTPGGVAAAAGGAPAPAAAIGTDPALISAINANTQKLDEVRQGIGTTVNVNQTWTGEPVPNRLDVHRRARAGYLAEFD